MSACFSPHPIFGSGVTTTIVASGEPTSVHKALEIPEVLGFVYDELAQENKQGTLASMAQVCRQFTEPALDMIWRKLVGLTPLLSVLPGVRCARMIVLVTCENSDPDGWHLFDTYASRVREFTQIPNVTNLQILHILIHERTKTQSIFPNLRILNPVYISDFTSPHFLEHIIPPSLSFLEVITANKQPGNMDYKADMIRRMFDILAIHNETEVSESSQLQHLRLYDVMPSSHLDKLLSLRQLRVLYLWGITPESVEGIDYLECLSTLPYLCNLGFSLQENEVFRSVPQDGFPSLKKLVIQSNALSLQSFVAALPPDRLTSISISDSISDWTSSALGPREVRTRLEEWRACFAALVKHSGAFTTLNITLCNTNSYLGDLLAVDLRLMSVIEPLLELRALQSFELAGFIKTPYSDADIRDFATAWPKIEHMALPPPLAEIEQPTFMSLKFFSRYCQHLGKLSIGLDAKHCEPTIISEQSKYLESDVVPSSIAHPLQKLHVCDSYLTGENVPWLVGQLREWFPNLKRVTAAQSPEVAAEVSAALLQL